ncbi:MAG: AmmeMemoRadiSam system protein B [Sulfurospirillum sp.]|nr:MAG: AmmeMemoRadiSam system protein B [Sulfurospirillum sp.]
MSIAKAGVRGSFYPQSCSEIERMIKGWNEILDSHLKDKSILNFIPKAIISPHAGYIYSGFTANFAHRILANAKAKRVVVFGPSHHVFIDGVSISEFDYYETPCGNLSIDKEYIKKLKSHFHFTFEPKAHQVEHSTETQFPFIHHYDKSAKVVEIIYGKIDFHYISKIMDFVLKEKDTVIVVSTDLSHFYTQDQANRLDNVCLEAVAKLDIHLFERGCEACGIMGVKAIVESAKRANLGVKILDYRTSADASGDASRVVGYMSAIFG